MLDAIMVVVDRADASKVQKDILRRKFKKLARRGQLESLALDEDWKHRLCVARFILGDFSNYDGWEYRDDFSKTFQNYPVNRWDGKETPIYLMGEQGLGDEIMYSSIIPELIVRFGKENIFYDGEERLAPIMERSFGIKCGPRKTLHDYENKPVIALADLSRFYRRDISHFPGKPFLTPNPDYVQYWRDWLRDYPNVGIAWKGRQGEIDPRDFFEGEAIDLQYGDHEDVPGLIRPPVDHVEEVDKSIALVSVLDRVISVPQTVIHFAGSLGIPCDVVIPEDGSGEISNALDWCFFSNMPWYNSITVYRSLYEYTRRE
jgi:hypothetical protein